jgi:hypothetical protein
MQNIQSGTCPSLAAATMSRQPSPGPAHSSHSLQMYHQPPLAPSSSKQKNKPHVPGITAGAEDVKYQAKYKELKKKVKEIELVCTLSICSAICPMLTGVYKDNDRLYLKLLMAKKNIRRMNLERA